METPHSETHLPKILPEPSGVLDSHVTSEKSLNLAKPQFPDLYNRGDGTSQLTGLL